MFECILDVGLDGAGALRECTEIEGRRSSIVNESDDNGEKNELHETSDHAGQNGNEQKARCVRDRQTSRNDNGDLSTWERLFKNVLDVAQAFAVMGRCADVLHPTTRSERGREAPSRSLVSTCVQANGEPHAG